MGEKIGRAKEVIGWATGDREVEAKGRVEQDVADPDTEVVEATDDAVADEQLAVREQHSEHKPDKLD
ncbi:MAG: hypothetical protein NVSMB4_11320 [Acidimicrobiales bacterium]